MIPFRLDLSRALRSLRKVPGFTLAAMLTLALGIGATTALFSITNQLLQGRLPYPAPERLVAVYQTLRGNRSVFAHQSLTEWRDRSTTLSDLGGFRQAGLNLTGLGDPRVLRGARVTAGYFEALQARPMLGRIFTRDDEKAGASDKVILSYGTWRDVLGSDPGAVGRSLTLDGRPMEVVGVMPRTFLTPFARNEEIFKVEPNAYTDNQRGNHSYEAIGRLAPGVSLASARQEMRLMAAQEAQAFPDSSVGLGADMEPLRQALTREGRTPLLFLLGATGLLLLIACVNVTNLFLARAAARERDMAVRLALGAGRRDLLRTFLAEATVISTGGVLFSLLLAQGLIRALEPFVLRGVPASLLAGGLRVSLPALAFALAITLLCTVVVALAPTLQADRLSLREILSEGGRGLTSIRGLRFRRILVASQVGLCLLLVLSTALFLRTLLWIQDQDPGFRAEGRVAFQVRLPSQDYPKEAQVDRFYRDLLARLRAIPGVAAADAGAVLPFSGSHSRTIVFKEGQTPELTPDALEADMNIVTPGWFETLGTPLVEGRYPTEADTQSGGRRIWISRSLARKLYPEGAVGHRMRTGAASETTDGNTELEITGVVADVHERNLELPAEDRFWVLESAFPTSILAVVLKTDAPPQALRGSIQAALKGLDPRLPLASVERLQTYVDRSLQGRRMVTLLLGGFTLLALLLAGVGIHGVVAYQVAQRSREIGIRMALGAEARQVLGLILGQGLRLTAWGLAAGLVSSLALARLLASQVYGIRPLDPVSIASALAVLGGSALLASLLPALRATRVDPAVGLRAD